MILDMAPLLSGKQEKLSFSFTIPNGENVLPPDDVCFVSPLRVDGTVTDNAGYMTFSVHVEVDYVTACARCLDEVRGTFAHEFVRGIAVDGVLQEEDNDDFLIIRNGMLEPDDAIVEEVLLNFPMRFLCRDDCPGLCPKCGKRLADGDCRCSVKKEIDPRLAIFEKLLEK